MSFSAPSHATVVMFDVVNFTGVMRDDGELEPRVSEHQKVVMDALTSVVKDTTYFKSQKSNEGKRLKKVAPKPECIIPAGDGMCVIFPGKDDIVRIPPCDFIVQLCQGIYRHNQTEEAKGETEITTVFQIRIGICHDTIFECEDVHGRTTYSGNALNFAQRVMSFGGAGDILCRQQEGVEKEIKFSRFGFAKSKSEVWITKKGEEIEICSLFKQADDTFTACGNEHAISCDKPLIKILHGWKECFKLGLKMAETPHMLYTMICLDGSIPADLLDEESKYRESIHRFAKDNRRRLYRWFNLNHKSVRDYAAEFASHAGPHTYVAHTDCRHLDVLIADHPESLHQALFIFPKREEKSLPETWGIYIKGHNDLIQQLKDWYESILTSDSSKPELVNGKDAFTEWFNREKVKLGWND
jgi:hypothetical protein